MAKKVTALALVALLTAGFIFAQELEISGEMKTGFYWEQIEVNGKKTFEDAKMHNNDDAGPNQGRFRLNLHTYNEHNMGMKVRFEQTAWGATQPNQWAYAMAYGNFLDNQLRVTIGRLGESPWGAGGPDLWNELDNQVGIRTEIMPHFAPGLDIGFVLNSYNGVKHNEFNDFAPDNKLVDMLRETVLGIAYTNDYFHGRFALRLDGEVDSLGASFTDPTKDLQENMELVYRLEERIIRQVLPGFSIWANGYWKGVGEDPNIKDDDSFYAFLNYLYIDYSPEAFSARLGAGLFVTKGLNTLVGRASFYYNIFPFLSLGAAGNYRQVYGKYAPDDGKPFLLWGVEPQLRITFNPNAYIAFVYNYGQEYVSEGQAARVLQDKQWVNLRVVYTF